MKLTQKQMEVVNRAKELEKEYGKGNVFIRYINDYWRTCFIVHKVGMNTFDVKLIPENRVNGKIINALMKKDLITACDNQHNENVDPNSWIKQPEGRFCIGSRIKTELI